MRKKDRAERLDRALILGLMLAALLLPLWNFWKECGQIRQEVFRLHILAASDSDQDQQNKLASYFGVSLFYLRGETNDTTQMSDWMDGAFLDEPAPVPAPRRAAVKPAVAASSGGEGGTMFDAFLTSKKFQEALRTAVLDTLRTPEGQELLTKAIRKELANRQK